MNTGILLSDDERDDDRCIHELFEDHARLASDSVAVEYGDQQLTYGALDERANALARHLRSLGVGSDEIVGLCVERSIEMVVGLLGILKAGAAYLPLDPEYPKERLTYMLDDAGVRVLLTQSALVEKLPKHGARCVVLDRTWDTRANGVAAAVGPPAYPTSLAYVIYTSGSTGKPKGVMALHRNVRRLVKRTSYAEIGSGDVLLHISSLSFDASTFEIWAALLNGARLVLYPERLIDIARLKDVIESAGVTVLHLTAGVFHNLVDYCEQAPASVRHLLAGADVLSITHVRKVIAEWPSCRLTNCYGPTESTTFTTCFSVPRLLDVRSVPIGRPIANTDVHVLDERLEPVAPGAIGELYIGGQGLARGYLNRPALTAERFVAHPLGHAERLYYTGDRVRYLPDGNLEFLGRGDHQVKIRGVRVELAEVEAALLEHAAVKQAIVVAREDASDDKRLIAYAVPFDRPREGLAGELREALSAKLPQQFVPSAFVLLDEFRLTVNGKIDRDALPLPEHRPALSQQYVAPGTPIEQEIATFWGEVLRLDRVGAHDNFFELGGNSLIATRVIARIRQVFAIELPLRVMFEAPSVAALADLIVQHVLEGHSDSSLTDVFDGTDTTGNLTQGEAGVCH